MPVNLAEVENSRAVHQTVPLTEALERGRITPDEYVRLRWKVIGRTTILQTVVMPLLMSLLSRLRGGLYGFPMGNQTRKKPT
jgi:hypothetical protein